jgi:hypothetical protein
MFLKIIIILMLLIVLISLFSGLVFMNRDGGRGRRTARALTVRIAVSLLLFGVLVMGFHLGWFSRS